MTAGIRVNKQRCCQILGWTRPEFDRHARQGMPVIQCPGDKGGEYTVDTAEVIRWLVSRAAGAANGTEVLDLSQERARLAKEQAAIAALRHQEMLGELLPADAVIEGWQAAIGRARSLILGLPGAHADELVDLAVKQGPRAVRDFLAERLHEALSELARTDPDDDPDPESAGEGRAAPVVGAVGAAA